MKHVLTTCLLLSLFTFTTLSANKNPIHLKDSLYRLIPTLEGKEKLKTYDNILAIYGRCVTQENLSDFYTFCNEFDHEASMQNDFRCQANIKLYILIVNHGLKNFEEVDKRIDSTIEFLRKHNYIDDLYQIYEQYIISYCARGMYDKALAKIEEARIISKNQNDENSQFYFLHLMGVTYMHQNRLEEAEQHYRESIAIAEKSDQQPPYIIRAYLEFANMLQANKKFDEFFTVATKCEELIESLSKKYSDKDFSANTATLWTAYAYAYCALKDFDKAESYCDKLEKTFGGQQHFTASINDSYLRSGIANGRGDYDKALYYIDKVIKLVPDYKPARLMRLEILADKENAPLTMSEARNLIEYSDSLHKVYSNTKIDELQTQFKVDRHIADKERAQSHLFFAVSACILLIITLGVWIYFSHRISGKNKTLANQIKELQKQQEISEKAFLEKTSFDLEAENPDNDLCPEKYRDRLCISIRDIMLKDKIYRDPQITRDLLIERLGATKELFIEVFQYCFNMTFPEYLNYLRLKDAITLLDNSDLSIEAISDKVGYGTVRTFQRQFQSKYNMSPKEYRKSIKR